MYYDVDQDIVYYSCLTQAELLLLIIFSIFVYKCIEYIVRKEFFE